MCRKKHWKERTSDGFQDISDGFQRRKTGFQNTILQGQAQRLRLPVAGEKTLKEQKKETTMNTTRKGFIAGLSALFSVPVFGLSRKGNKRGIGTSGLSGMTCFPVKKGHEYESGWEHKTNAEKFQDVVDVVKDLSGRCRLERVCFDSYNHKFQIAIPVRCLSLCNMEYDGTAWSVEDLIKWHFPKAEIDYTTCIFDGMDRENVISVSYRRAVKCFSASLYGI